jgi:hypothetical protein
VLEGKLKKVTDEEKKKKRESSEEYSKSAKKEDFQQSSASQKLSLLTKKKLSSHSRTDCPCCNHVHEESITKDWRKCGNCSRMVPQSLYGRSYTCFHKKLTIEVL